MRDAGLTTHPVLQPHSDRDFEPNAYPIIYVPLLESSLYDLISVLVVLFDRYVPSYTLLCLHNIPSFHASSVLSTFVRRISPPHGAETPMEISNHTAEHCSKCPPDSQRLFSDICMAKVSGLVSISDRVNLDSATPCSGLGLGRQLGTSVDLHTQYDPAFDIQPPSNAP